MMVHSPLVSHRNLRKSNKSIEKTKFAHLPDSHVPVEPKAGAGVAAPKAGCAAGVAPNGVGAAAPVCPNEKFPNAAENPFQNIQNYCDALFSLCET